MGEKVRFGFLLYLLEKLGENRYYGMIVVQKIVYFLKEAFQVDLPYEFYFYHFGPYSDVLDWDLQMMKAFDLIRIGSDPNKTGYSIEVDRDNSAEGIKPAKGFISDNEEKVDQVLKLFERYQPSELELASTVHFVYSNLKRARRPSKAVVVERVKELKPKFNQRTILREFDYLQAKGIIK